MALTRREFNAGAVAAAGALAMPSIGKAQAPTNVIMIPVDDMNDWIGPLGGYPLAAGLTPNYARLAARGITFRRGYTVSPYCATSRVANLFGLYPWVTGCYAQGEDWSKGSRIASGQFPLPYIFRQHGYYTAGVGKVFHDGWRFSDGLKKQERRFPAAWDTFEQCNVAGSCWVDNELQQGGILSMAIGPTKELSPDGQRTKWFVDNVVKVARGQPVFGVLGLNTPHLRWTPPAEFYNAINPANVTYPLGVMTQDARQDITLATNLDLSDEPSSGLELARTRGGTEELRDIIQTGRWKEVIRYYLAEIRLHDWCLGQLLDALDDPSSALNWSNTTVCLWSDHGWQLGEKLAWHKFTLWERATRIPYFIAGAGVTPGVCDTPISAIDIFPTLCDQALGFVPGKDELGSFALSGESRKSWLTSPAAARTNRVLQIWSAELGEQDKLLPNPQDAHYAIVTNEWGMSRTTGKATRLIQYNGGDRAFYGPDDQWEWTNLYERPSPETIARANSLTRYLPAKATMAPRAGNDPDVGED